MRLLIHLMAADVRRFKLAIAAWVAVVVAASALEAVIPLAGGDPPLLRALVLAAFLLGLARVLLVVALVPLVVQAHPLVGSEAFWMTRPISPRTLLLSKLILLSALLLVVPFVCDLVVMAVYGIPAGDIAQVTMQSALWRSLILIVLMVGAAITLNLARFALLGGSALLLLAVLVAVGSLVLRSRVDEMAGDAHVVAWNVSAVPAYGARDETAGIAGGLIFIAAGVALLSVQYRRRSVRRSVFVGVVGTGVAWAVASIWPWALIDQPPPVPEWASSASALRLSANPLSVTLDPSLDFGRDRPRIWRVVRARAVLSNVAPEWVATARLAAATLELDSDIRLTSLGHGYPASLPVDEKDEPPSQRALRNVLGVRNIIGAPPSRFRGESAVVLLVRDENLRSYRERIRDRSALAKYHGSFFLDLTRLEIASRLPLERNAAFQDGAYHLTIEEIAQGRQGMTIRVISTHVNTMFDRRQRPTYSYYLRNRQLAEATAGSLQPLREPFLLPFFGMSDGFTVGAYLLTFPASYGLPEERVELDSGWLMGAELVIVRTIAEGAVSRTLEMDGVQLSETPPKE